MDRQTDQTDWPRQYRYKQLYHKIMSNQYKNVICMQRVSLSAYYRCNMCCESHAKSRWNIQTETNEQASTWLYIVFGVSTVHACECWVLYWKHRSTWFSSISHSFVFLKRILSLKTIAVSINSELVLHTQQSTQYKYLHRIAFIYTACDNTHRHMPFARLFLCVCGCV